MNCGEGSQNHRNPPPLKTHAPTQDSVAESLFRDGLCLPSGSNLTDDDLERVTSLIRFLRTG